MAERTADNSTVLEQFPYRARKWAFQRLTSASGADQHQRISEEEWDILIILDACRLDICRDVASWPVGRVTTPASCTPEWLEEIAAAGLFAETTVLTANPQYEKFDIKTTATENFWDTHWDSQLETVLPEPILERVGDLLDGEANDVVAHLQQPHWPYVAKIDENWHLAYDDMGPWEFDSGSTTEMQVAMARGEIDVDKARRAYRASVRSIWRTLLPFVERWVTDGNRVVVTADHGEVFGKLKEGIMYEHPCGCHLRDLTAVPWVEFPPVEMDGPEPATGTVTDRLEALGYAE